MIRASAAVTKPKRGSADETGNVYGRLTVIRRSPVSVKYIWLCRCECGNLINLRPCHFRSGRYVSCGCAARDNSVTHGHARRIGNRDSEYTCWASMKQRCVGVGSTSYRNYGGRGITICERWLDSFENFLADMGPKPTPGHTIDRIDVNGNYEPGNCRWATYTEQANNKTTNVVVTVNGQSHTVAEWAAIMGVSRFMIYQRITKLGWSPERAVTTPHRYGRKVVSQ